MANLSLLILLIIFAPWIIKGVRKLFSGFVQMIRNFNAEVKKEKPAQSTTQADTITPSEEEIERFHKLGQILVEQQNRTQPERTTPARTDNSSKERGI